MTRLSRPSFGEVLQNYRKQRNMKQRVLARSIGVHINTIGAWERGSYLPATRGTVLELARSLELNEEETTYLLEASLLALPHLWNMPYQRNPFFTGREQFLHNLHRLLQQGGIHSQAYALSGLGGVGKTQIAIEYAYRYFLDYSAVLWLEADTAEHLQVNFLSIATLLNLPERLERDQHKVVEAVIYWLNTHRDWLLIVDNVEDLRMVKASLPTARQGTLLFTTRLLTLETLACLLEVERMSPEEGSQLLLRRTSSADPQTGVEKLAQREKSAIWTIVAELDGLPLALDQAGAYVKKSHCSWSELLRLFQMFPIEMLNEWAESTDHPLSVVRMFTLTLDHLQQHHPAAAELLTLCCFLTPDAIPESLITEYSEYLSPSLRMIASHPLYFNTLCSDILASSLIRYDEQTRTFSILRLAQVIIKRSIPKPTQQKYIKQALRLVNLAFPAGDFATWAQCERYLAQAQACLQQMPEPGRFLPEAGELFWKVGRYLLGCGRFEEVGSLLEKAVILGELHFGPNHLALLSRLSTQSELF